MEKTVFTVFIVNTETKKRVEGLETVTTFRLKPQGDSHHHRDHQSSFPSQTQVCFHLARWRDWLPFWVYRDDLSPW